MKKHTIKIRNIKIGRSEPLVLIAGPCVIENEESSLFHAEEISKIAKQLEIPFIFKSSYDKANRTYAGSYRGPGIKKGLAILKKVKEKIGIPVLSDIHCCNEIKEAAAVLDVIQIPSLLSRQTDLLQAAARSGKPINIKKGQFSAPWDMGHAIEKIEKSGNHKIMITERGTCFGYNNLVSDMRSLPILSKFGYPVIYDASHSVQFPSSLGKSSGGQSELIQELALAATAIGIDGLFIEVHRDPSAALCDGTSMINIKKLKGLLIKVLAIKKAIACA